MSGDFSELLNDYRTAASAMKNKIADSNSSVRGSTQTSGTGSHACKTCNMSFRKREMLFEHLSSHVQCDEGECDFVGIGSAVAKHKREEHEESECVQIFAMEHPAVLEAWLQQRRKNFPSSGNLQLKKLREEAKIDFGIVAKDKSYTLKGRKWGVKRHKTCIPEASSKPVSTVSPNDPLSFILDSETKSNSPQSLLGIGAYNSSGDSDSDMGQSDATCQDSSPSIKQTLNKFKQYAKWRGAEGNPKRRRRKWNGVMKSGRRRYQPTLLQRLLDKDITRDNNKILQCFRYMVNNNFFEPPVIMSDDTVTNVRSNEEPLSNVERASPSKEDKESSNIDNASSNSISGQISEGTGEKL